MVASFGVFQLWFTAAVRLGLSFDVLFVWLFLPALAAGALALWLASDPGPDETPAAVAEPSALSTALIVPIAALCFSFGSSVPFTAFWALALVLVLAQLRPGAGTVPTVGGFGRADAAGLGLAALGAALATLWIHRPEGDDGFYLAQAVQTVLHGELPVMGFDVLHGDTSVPVQQPAHRAQGYEVMIAVLYRATRLFPLDLYYRVLPPVMGALSVVPSWLVLRRWFGRRAATIGVGILVVLLSLWAGHYYSFGNFTYARMFQGKGVLVGLMLPLLVHYAAGFAARPDARSWVALVLAQCAAALASSTGMIVAPICAALIVLPALTLDRDGLKRALGGLASVLPILLMLAFVHVEASAMAGPGDTGGRQGIREVLGRGAKVPVVLLFSLYLPTFMAWMKLPGAPWMGRYTLAWLFFLAHPYGRGLLADIGGDLLSWRSLWAIPFPLWVSGAAALCVEASLWHSRLPIRLLGLAGVIAMSRAFALRSAHTWDASNHASLHFAEWKLPEAEGKAALATKELTSPGEIIAAVPQVVVYLTIWPDRPQPIVVRRSYNGHLAHVFGPEETRRRQDITEFLYKATSRTRSTWFLDQMDARCVTTLVLRSETLEVKTELPRLLIDHGWGEALDDGALFTPSFRIFQRQLADCTPTHPTPVPPAPEASP